MIKKNILEEVSNKEFLQALNELPFNQVDNDDEAKLESMIINLNHLYKQTKKELKGLLTINEAFAIVQVFCGSAIEEFEKSVLISNLEDELRYSDIENMFSIDGTALLSKISKLTEFQSMVLLGMVFEYGRSTQDSWITHDEAKKIFMIS